MWAVILEAIVAIFKALPVLERLFKESTEKKVQEKKEDREKEFDEFEKMEPPK